MTTLLGGGGPSIGVVLFQPPAMYLPPPSLIIFCASGRKSFLYPSSCLTLIIATENAGGVVCACKSSTAPAPRTTLTIAVNITLRSYFIVSSLIACANAGAHAFPVIIAFGFLSTCHRCARHPSLFVVADATAQIADLGYQAYLCNRRRVGARLWKHVADLGDLTFLRRAVEIRTKHLA